MSKIQIREKVSKKKNFFYRNKLKTFFQVLRAFSRKITFLHFFGKNAPKPIFPDRVLKILERLERGAFCTITLTKTPSRRFFWQHKKKGIEQKNAAAFVVTFSAFFSVFALYGLIFWSFFGHFL